MSEGQGRPAEAEAQLAAETVMATAGSGPVTIIFAGDLKGRAMEVSEDALKDVHSQMLHALILAAVNLGRAPRDAHKKGCA